MDVPAWLPRAATARPDRVAVAVGGRELTYADLHGQAVERVRAGVPGVLEGPPSADWVIGLHANLLAGVPSMPIDPRLAEGERASRRALAGSRGAATVQATHDLDAVALRLFTSGTTSAPKPVALTYGNLLWSAMGSALALGLDPGERWLCPLPLAHVGGLSILVRSAIYATTAVVHERWDTDRALHALRGEGITLASLVPTQLARLLDAGLERPPVLRWILLGGAPAPPALLRRAQAAGVPVAETYGMTEAASQIVTFGRPLPFATVELAPDGEIVVAGPTVAGGGPLRTGDLGAYDADGRLRVVGRKADTIVSGGENVAPQEVEAVLAAHPAIADAAVVGRPDPEWGEALVALVVPRNGEPPAPEELNRFCRERLAAFKVPKRFVAVPELPRNAAGKLSRKDLPR
jgi:O-succinylbenzoic acid--CoA ligase